MPQMKSLYEGINRKARARRMRSDGAECAKAGYEGFAEALFEGAEWIDPTPRPAPSEESKRERHSRNSQSRLKGQTGEAQVQRNAAPPRVKGSGNSGVAISFTGGTSGDHQGARPRDANGGCTTGRAGGGSRGQGRLNNRGQAPRLGTSHTSGGGNPAVSSRQGR